MSDELREQTLADPRRRWGVWYGRYFVSVCVWGYGLSLGMLREYPKWDDWLPVRPFRNAGYRGPFDKGLWS